jgi:hypothetical protein
VVAAGGGAGAAAGLLPAAHRYVGSEVVDENVVDVDRAFDDEGFTRLDAGNEAVIA